MTTIPRTAVHPDPDLPPDPDPTNDSWLHLLQAVNARHASATTWEIWLRQASLTEPETGGGQVPGALGLSAKDDLDPGPYEARYLSP